MEQKTIFIVDDSIISLDASKRILSPYYEVHTLNSGQLFLSRLELKRPDLVLLDVDMPEMDGYDIIKAMKANPKTAGIPVIFLTAFDDDAVEYEGLSLGAVDYIRKPFAPKLLLKRIELHLLIEAQKNELKKFNDSLTNMVDEKTKTVVELKDAVLFTMAELVERRDGITGSHILRTQLYIKALIDAMREYNIYTDLLSKFEESLIIQSCQLHDVGKISVRDAVLSKPAKLTPEEFEHIKTHTTAGEEIIKSLKNRTRDNEFLEYARIFAISHHEKWDGTGYPYGLKGDDIPLLGRMMALVDVYDALITPRPYKEAFPHSLAKKIITDGKGTHFDPLLIGLFEKVHMQFSQIAIENSD